MHDITRGLDWHMKHFRRSLPAIGLIAASVFAANVVNAAPTKSQPADMVRPGAISLRVFFWPSLTQNGNQGDVVVKSRSTVTAVTRTINSYGVRTKPLAGAGEPPCQKPKLRTMSYTLRFSYKRSRSFVFLVCGTIWNPQTHVFSFVRKPLSYRLARIVRTATHSRRLCRQWWHRDRLRVCRLDI